MIETDLPARLDRLPWARFHTLVVLALGITWVLDGLEVTLTGSLAGAFLADRGLGFTPRDVGFANSAYLAGAVLGALFFGWLTDRLGRRKLFFITLGTYTVATIATAFAHGPAWFFACRFVTGAGIGGEYAAVNATIQELIPARARGAINLAVNGTFWLGAAVGSLAAVVLLDPAVVAPDRGWRIAFFLGGTIGLLILFLRRWIPESPRWLIMRGEIAEAERVVAEVETAIVASGHMLPPLPTDAPRLRITPRRSTPLGLVFRAMMARHRRATLVGLSLMVAQAFFYNGVYFTYGLVLLNSFHVLEAHVGWYLLPFAVGNFLGPLLLGPLFDSVGRRPMIAVTYGVSAVLMLGAAVLFLRGGVGPAWQTAAWSAVFFVASAAASSAYLTVSETFPLEIRALAIAAFYAIGTGIGGIIGPALFGVLADSGARGPVFWGYAAAAALMAIAALIGGRYALAAEGRSLESIAEPLGAA